MTNFKSKQKRDSKYLQYVRQQGCVICGKKVNIEAHHTEGGGMGLKGSDYSCVGLCPFHHGEVHRIRKDAIPNLQQILERLIANYRKEN